MQSLTQRREISQTITQIEKRDVEALKALAQLFNPDSFKKTVCFTGPAGVGKSTLISSLIPFVIKEHSLAWLACDPTSFQTGGSLLGDRIRFSSKNESDRLFIRSLATRSTHAFSPAIRDLELFLENHFDQVWVETTGTGQTQNEVTQISALTVLVLQPETGDDIQFMKSGLREGVDLFIVHKSDLLGADMIIENLKEQGVSADRIWTVSSKKRSGLQEAAEGILKAQHALNWKRKSAPLHERLAHDLYMERGYLRLQKDFEGVKGKLIKNPYEEVLRLWT